MKRLLENFKNFLMNEEMPLNEAELKYSASAAEQILERALHWYQKMPNVHKEYPDEDKTVGLEQETVDIPLEELLYESKTIKNGIPFIVFWHAQSKLDNKLFMENMQKQWNAETKQFSENWMGFTNGFMAKSPFKLNVDVKWMGIGNFGFFGRGSRDDDFWSVLGIGPWAHVENGELNVNKLKSTIRHELQHLTQRLNGLALKYGKLAEDSNGDFSKIKKLKWGLEKEFGTGRETTGLRQISRQQAREAGISDDERIKRYLGDDFEYETWMSDMIDDLIPWLKTNGHIKPHEIAFAKFRGQFANVMNEDQNQIMLRKMMIQNAKQIGIPVSQYRKQLKNARTFDKIAADSIKLLFRNDEILTAFAEDTIYAYQKAVKTLLKLRAKEFAGDFMKNLKLRLEKEAEAA